MSRGVGGTRLDLARGVSPGSLWRLIQSRK